MNRFFFALLLSSLVSACSDKASPDHAEAATSNGITSVTTTRPTAIPEQLTITQDCSVDLVNDVIATDLMPVIEKTNIRLSGWAADSVAGTLPKAVYLEIGGANKVYAKVAIGSARPDVATHFAKPGLANSGWQSTLDMNAIRPGNYDLRIIQLADATNTICDARKALKLN